jgi:hypothetical protein
MSGCGFDRYNQYCTSFGCFNNVYRDDIENPFPSLGLTGLTLFVDPRVPSNIKDAFCGPMGCAGPLPQFPARAPLSCEAAKAWQPR